MEREEQLVQRILEVAVQAVEEYPAKPESEVYSTEDTDLGEGEPVCITNDEKEALQAILQADDPAQFVRDKLAAVASSEKLFSLERGLLDGEWARLPVETQWTSTTESSIPAPEDIEADEHGFPKEVSYTCVKKHRKVTPLSFAAMNVCRVLA